jgi:hypothetical protein
LDAGVPGAPADQLALTLGPLFVVEVSDRFSPGLTGRHDRDYRSPPQPRADALALAGFLVDAAEPLEGDGPWQRAIAGGRRIVTLAAAPAGAVW